MFILQELVHPLLPIVLACGTMSHISLALIDLLLVSKLWYIGIVPLRYWYGYWYQDFKLALYIYPFKLGMQANITK